MNVLFWMNIGFDTQSTSGHLLCSVIKELVKSNNRVHILQTNQNGPYPSIPPDINDSHVTYSCIIIHEPPKRKFLLRYFSEIKYCLACRKEFRKHKNFDAVFIQSSNVAGFVVWLIKHYLKKAIVTLNVQDIFPYNAVYSNIITKNSITFKLLAAVQRYAYQKVDHIITISEDMRDLLIEDYVPPEKISVIYNWSYRDDIYNEQDLRPVSEIFKGDFFKIVYAGNIGVMQNVDIIIEAARILKNRKDIWFYIIGDGVYKEQLIDRAKMYQIANISFYSMQPSELAPLIYSSADVNVVSLMNNVIRTALPSKIATCFACQKPVIFATGKDGIFLQKVLKETGCPIVNSNSPQELANAIEFVQKNKNDFNLSGFYKKYMGKTRNSQRYAEIITKRDIDIIPT